MLQSGQGVTQLVTKALFDTIDTILCYPGKIDELVVILDAEELECESRKRQVLAKVNEKYMLGELPFHLEILVCNHCFETWLLGRKGLYPKELVPSESFFYPYYNHFDIENRDPEIMGVPVGVNETIGKYHFHYLHEILRYKNIRYSKKRPGFVLSKESFMGIVTRVNETGQISSFQEFYNYFMSKI